ncbi:MAG: hypothetical protein ABIL78_06355 [candidate division WOR-3 bacterium]
MDFEFRALKFKNEQLYFYLLLFAQDKDYEITKISATLEEKEEIKPDIIIFNISIIANADVDKAIRNFNLEYSGGSYSVQENCWIENNKKKCAGYYGELNYVFRLENPSEQNKIIDTLNVFKGKYNEKMKYQISRPSWAVSERKLKEVEEELKLKLIDKAKDFSNKVSKRLNKECFVQSINYDVIYPILRPYILTQSTSAPISISSQAPEPKEDEFTIRVKAAFNFVCK